jgi:hypothetical protein
MGTREELPMACQHEWVVFSTALRYGVLMVECADCHAFGIIGQPSWEEWAAAHHAPKAPYRWEHGGRVRVIKEAAAGPSYVRRTPDGGFAPSDRWAALQEQAAGGGLAALAARSLRPSTRPSVDT